MSGTGRQIAWDLVDGQETYFVLDRALEDFADAERDEAKKEGGNPDRERWADRADAMRIDLNTAMEHALAA